MAANSRYYVRLAPEANHNNVDHVTQVNGVEFGALQATKAVLPGYEFVDAFIHIELTASGNGGEWAVSEARTGLMMQKGKTREEAIRMAVRALNMGYQSFVTVTNDLRQKGQYTPFYQDALDMGYPKEV